MSISSVIKIALATALVLLFVFGALGPAKLQFRPGVGWQLEHFVGYFVVTFVLCLMWPRRLLVGGGLMAFALLLEGLQALTPDRCCDLETALYSVGGVMAALLPADMSIRALERLDGWIVLTLHRRARWLCNKTASMGLLTNWFGSWVRSRALPIRGLMPFVGSRP